MIALVPAPPVVSVSVFRHYQYSPRSVVTISIIGTCHVYASSADAKDLSDQAASKVLKFFA